MKTLLVSKFKAQCLGLLREIRDTGEPLAITLRGETLAIVQAPGSTAINRRETVVETLHRIHPLLLVEDEESLCRIAKIYLEGLGYAVLSSCSPLEAIRLAEEYEGEIHLLLTDVIMPRMSGKSLRDRIISMRPDIKCLFMSGYTIDIIAGNGVLHEGIHFIQKPFSAEVLSAKLRKALAS